MAHSRCWLTNVLYGGTNISFSRHNPQLKSSREICLVRRSRCVTTSSARMFYISIVQKVKRYTPVNRICLRAKYFAEQPALGASDDVYSIECEFSGRCLGSVGLLSRKCIAALCCVILVLRILTCILCMEVQNSK